MIHDEVHERALGAYLGFAVGDALGATVEFMMPAEIQHAYGMHRDMIGGGWLKLKPGQVTDDTQMSLVLGQSIIDSGGWNATAAANRTAPRLKSGEIDPALVDAQAALEMMLSDPLLIRRPLIEADGWHLAGFDATQIELRLGAAAHGEAQPDPENCSRPHAATPCATPQGSALSDIERARIALAYHERTKHRPDRYASGPETLDWTMQPDPFRTFKGSPSIRLPHCASRMALAFEHADKPEAFIRPQSPSIRWAPC